MTQEQAAKQAWEERAIYKFYGMVNDEYRAEGYVKGIEDFKSAFRAEIIKRKSDYLRDPKLNNFLSKVRAEECAEILLLLDTTLPLEK